jgi:hypothetical protein
MLVVVMHEQPERAAEVGQGIGESGRPGRPTGTAGAQGGLEGLQRLGQDELKSYMEQGKSYTASARAEFAWLDQLPPHVKAQYDYLTRKLTNADLGDADRKQVFQEIEELIRPYKPAPTH